MTSRGFPEIIRDRKKLAFPVLAALLLTPWPVAYAHNYTDNMGGQDTARIEVAEASAAPSTGAVSNDAVITAPETVLPDHVYVLNNREIVTKKPSSEMDKLQSTAEDYPSHRDTASHGATITASVTVTPSRLIVVDENDTIVEIWSNTTGMNRYFYSLWVKEQSRQGSEHTLTQGILAQYNHLLNEVDWSKKGMVY